MAHIDTDRLQHMADEWHNNAFRPTNLTCLGQGAYRTVYALDATYVVKFDHVRRTGNMTCEYEARVWEAAKGTQFEHLFAPIVASGEGWLVMRRVDHFWENASHAEHAAAENLRNQIETAFGFCDMHGGNIGFLNGTPVVTDYAHRNLLDGLTRKAIVAVANAMASDAGSDDVLDAAAALALWRKARNNR